MSDLDKCALCTNEEDPRFGATFRGRRYPLCDGCGGPENEKEERELAERLAAVPPPPDRWRTGRSVGRTLYKNDVLVGMVDTVEIAAQIVAVMNGRRGEV